MQSRFVDSWRIVIVMPRVESNAQGVSVSSVFTEGDAAMDADAILKEAPELMYRASILDRIIWHIDVPTPVTIGWMPPEVALPASEGVQPLIVVWFRLPLTGPPI